MKKTKKNLLKSIAWGAIQVMVLILSIPLAPLGVLLWPNDWAAIKNGEEI